MTEELRENLEEITKNHQENKIVLNENTNKGRVITKRKQTDSAVEKYSF